MDRERQSSAGAASATTGTEDRGDAVGGVDPRELPANRCREACAARVRRTPGVFLLFRRRQARQDQAFAPPRRRSSLRSASSPFWRAGRWSSPRSSWSAPGCAVVAQRRRRAWAGNLIVGLAVLLLVGGGTWFGMSYLTGKSRKFTVKKYELRLTRQPPTSGTTFTTSPAKHSQAQ